MGKSCTPQPSASRAGMRAGPIVVSERVNVSAGMGETALKLCHGRAVSISHLVEKSYSCPDHTQGYDLDRPIIYPINDLLEHVK